MKRIHFYLGTGFSNADYNEIVEFEDDATDEEINEVYEEWKADRLGCAWWNEDAEN